MILPLPVRMLAAVASGIQEKQMAELAARLVCRNIVQLYFMSFKPYLLGSG